MFRFYGMTVPGVLVVACVWLLASAADARAQGTGSIQGSVRSAETGEPIAGVSVFLRDGRIGGVTDRAGRFRLALSHTEVNDASA